MKRNILVLIILVLLLYAVGQGKVRAGETEKKKRSSSGKQVEEDYTKVSPEVFLRRIDNYTEVYEFTITSRRNGKVSSKTFTYLKRNRLKETSIAVSCINN